MVLRLANEPITDEDLVEQFRAAPVGDQRPFETLMRRYQGRVLANCRFLTNATSEADDLAQEVFIKAYFALRGYQGRASFRTWLMKIKAHHCIDFNRSFKPDRELALDTAVQQQRPELNLEATADEAIESSARNARVREVLAGLPETLRVPLVLRDMDGMTYHEIAETLGIGLSAAKMRVKRGREEFRRNFEPDPNAGDPPHLPDPAATVQR